MAEHVDCTGMTLDERKEERARRLKEKLAYNTARLKLESEERRLDELVKKDEEKYFNLIPEKAFIASYFLEERTTQMKMRGLRYRYKIPDEDENPEVTLQLWRRDQESGEEVLVADVGDLYTVTLLSPCGEGSFILNIIVESSESRKLGRSLLYYSVFDIGHAERAYSIPGEAWFTYMMYREGERGSRLDLDSRLLFIALGERGQLGENCTLELFKSFGVNDMVMLMQSMTPGKVYKRPTSSEAGLAMTKRREVEELLRSDPREEEDEKESVKVNLEERFNDMDIDLDLDYNVRITRSKLRAKQPRMESMMESPWNPEKTDLVMSVLKEVADPQSEENVQSRKIWEECLMAEKLFFPNFKRKGSKIKIKPGKGTRSGNGKEGQKGEEGKEMLKERAEVGPREHTIQEITEDEDEEARPTSSSSSSSSTSSSIHPEEEETYGFLTYVDDVGLVEIGDKVVHQEVLEMIPKEDGKDGQKNDQRVEEKEDDDHEMEDNRDDSKDFLPDQDDWDLKSMPSLTSEEEVHDISYLFNDSVEMMYLAKPVNESQIITLDTSESSATDIDPEEVLHVSCNCMQDTSRDMIDDDDEEELDVEIDFLYIPEV